MNVMIPADAVREILARSGGSDAADRRTIEAALDREPRHPLWIWLALREARAAGPADEERCADRVRAALRAGGERLWLLRSTGAIPLLDSTGR